VASIFKVVWEFAESNGSTFEEQYWVQADDVVQASKIFTNLRTARLGLLHPLNTWQRIRASDPTANRVTAVNNLGLSGQFPTANSPLPVGASIVCALQGASGGSRKLWMRGSDSSVYLRDKTSGRDIVSPQLKGLLDGLFRALALNSYGIRRLKPRDNLVLPNFKVSSVDGTTNDGQAKLTLERAPGWPVPSRVVLGSFSKKDLPALNGHFSVLNVVNNVITIPYQTPNAQKVDTTTGYARLEQYYNLSVFDPNGCAFDHFGTRTSKNPSSRSRGARRAARLRLSP